MAQGGVSNQVSSGGGPSGGSAAVAARTVILFGVSPAGTVNTLYNPGSASAIKSALDVAVLGEACAKLLEHGGTSVFACPLNPSTAGALSAAVTQVGNGAGTVTPALAPHKAITVKCILGGVVGVATFQFSLDGGVTYGATTTSAATLAVPGTFCTLAFAAAIYVATKTNTIGIDGTVTPGSGWVGTVTISAASPLDNYDVKLTVTKAGALGVCTVQASLDGGNSTLPNMLVPASGLVVLPGTGIYLTLASTFVLGDTYSFLAVPPGPSTSDITAAVNAVAALSNAPTVALCYLVNVPASAAGAISAASSLETALVNAAANNGKQWIGMCDAPYGIATNGDPVLSGGFAVVDTADTESVLRTARVGSTFNHTSVCIGTNRMTSSITGIKQKRPTGLALAARYVEDDPRNDLSAVARGPLDIATIGRDEQAAPSTLYDAQYNTLTTMPGRGTSAFVTIESGGFGWRNMTTDANFQDANSVRVLALFLVAITLAAQKYLGSRQPTNADGTIAESTRQAISGDLDGTVKRKVGIAKGGDFALPQASGASASVLASSQLGSSPHRLDIQYTLQSLGFVSQVNNAVQYGGTVSVGG